MGYLLIAFAVLHFILGQAGMCFGSFGWDTYDERMKRAYNALYSSSNSTGMSVYDVTGKSRRVARIPYASYEEFRLQNPDCCELALIPDSLFSDAWTQTTINVIAHLFFIEAIHVRMHYIEKLEYKGKLYEAPVTREIRVFNCGMAGIKSGLITIDTIF